MKRVVISSFVTLVIIGLIALAYVYFQRSTFITADPLSAVPENSIFFIETKSAKNALKKLTEASVWTSLSASDSSANLFSILDSAMTSNDEIKKIWEETEVYLSAHLTKANNFDYLYLAAMPAAWTEEQAEHFISKTFHAESSFSRRVYENVNVHELAVSPDKNFSFAIHKGVFIGSFTSFLIDESIRQMKNGTPVNKSKSFSAVAGTKSSGENLYINYKMIPEFLSAFSSGGSLKLFHAAGSVARWSRIQVSTQNNSLIFQGLTSSTDTSDLISALASQQPQRTDVMEILPSRTALFIHFGVNNYPSFINHLQSNTDYFDAPASRSGMLKSLDKKSGRHLEKELTEWIGNELALVITEPGSHAFANSSYAIIKAKDIDAAGSALKQIQNASEKNSISSKAELYRAHPIGYINLPGIVPLVYGNLFSNITHFYYTTAGSYVVIANQSAAIRSFIDDFEDNRTLSDDPAYKSNARNTLKSSNVFVYMNLERARNIFRAYASDFLDEMLSRNKAILTRFSAFSFQLANGNDGFVTSAQLAGMHEKINDVNLLWAAQLDTTLSSKPFVLLNTESKSRLIVSQDDRNTLYLMDDAGNAIWKKNLPEKIISGFHLVDAYRNGQQQILFNTGSQLYLVDLNGNDYGNYPIRLPALATNGCEVFDFDQSKNYTIIVACRNRMIYAYEISGKPMSGWLFNLPVSDVTKPVLNFKANGKDYLLVHNNTGTVLLLDKKGAVRIALKQTFISKNSSFFMIPGDSTEEDHLVAADTSGRVLSFYFDGRVKSKSYGTMSSSPAFAVADVDGDGNDDYAFLEPHHLKVIRKDSSVVYERNFTEALLPRLDVFFETSSMQQLGFGSSEKNSYFLLNKDGKTSNGFPVKGFTGTFDGDPGKKGTLIFVTSGTDGTVYEYRVD